MTGNTATAVRDDFRNVARSHAVRGVVGAFVAISALVFLAETDVHPDPYRTLFDVSQAVMLLGPLLLAPLTYAAVVGDRQSGRLRYVLGLPVGRRAYVVGTFAARLGVAALAALASAAVGFAVAAATFANAPDAGNFLLFGVGTLLYCLAFAALFVAVSAVARRRSRATVAVLAVYVALVPLWLGLAPPLTLDTAFAALESLPGVSLSDAATDAARSLSPMLAYARLTAPVFAEGADAYQHLSHYGGSPDGFYERPWFNAAVLLGWIVGSLAVALHRFRRAELG